MFERKGRDLLPDCFQYAITKDGFVVGVSDDAPEWAKKQYREWEEQRNKRHMMHSEE